MEGFNDWNEMITMGNCMTQAESTKCTPKENISTTRREVGDEDVHDVPSIKIGS